MPTGKNWFNFIFINLGFILFIVGIYYFISVKQIKDSWPQYRCNPMYMPLSDDIEKDFVYCIQTMQQNFMGYLLQPLTYISSALLELGGNFSNEINGVRSMFDTTRSFFAKTIDSVFGVFLNLVVEFQRITISIKDLVGKIIGIVVTMLYVLDGSSKTTQSMWNGPSGQMVRALGRCFYPNTKIKLQNNKVVKIKDIHLGDILEDGSVVKAVMKIDNTVEKEDLYIIPNAGVNGEDIFVTGSHMILDKQTNNYIEVNDYTKALQQYDVQTEWFSCLITDTHQIKIGHETFWDWEDYIHKCK